ncbi:MAG: MarR family transcriptional regulator [Sideroxydans sp.]|nr:MarR family transcriptional regulator [Sideroxydans sp.]
MDTQQQNAQAAQVLKQFRVIFRSVKKHFQYVEKRCQISGSQLWALALIAEIPGIRVTELAEGLSIHQSTASNLVDLLVQKKLIRRKRAANDNRIVKLYVTETGEAIIEKAPKPLRGILPDALAQLPPETLAQLNQCLTDLLQSMNSRDEEASGIPLADI